MNAEQLSPIGHKILLKNTLPTPRVSSDQKKKQTPHPNQTNFTRFHKLSLSYLFIFFPFCCWMESKIGLRSVGKKRTASVRKAAQTICFNQFKLTGISNLERNGVIQGWSLCLLLARLCHWAYCFLFLLLLLFCRALLHPSFTSWKRVLFKVSLYKNI